MEKNSVVLGALTFFSGFSGADRLYLKCWTTGLIKLALFIIAVATSFIWPASLSDKFEKIQVQTFLINLMVIWWSVDAVLILNQIKIGETQIFNDCGTSVKPIKSPTLIFIANLLGTAALFFGFWTVYKILF